MTARPPTASRIRRAREKAQLSHDEVAARIGVTREWYYDLESRDDEAFMTLSLTQLRGLGSALGVAVIELVNDENTPLPNVRVSYEELAVRVRAAIESEGIDVDAWGTKVGWDVADLLREPERTGDLLDLDGLRDICAAVGIDWRAVLSG